MTPAVTTVVRVGTWTFVGLLAALGLITAGAALALPTAVVASVGAVVGWALVRERRAWAALRLGAAGGAGVLALAGLALLTGAATLLAAPAIVAVLVWTRRMRSPQTAQPTAVEERSSLAQLSNAQLAREWHASYTALARARDPGSLEMICTLRRRQLDEIERRAPGGFHRWISSGSWVRGDSAPFLGG